MISKIRTSSQS